MELCRKIKEKHGAAASRIKLYKDLPTEKNILLDMDITLTKAGFQGISGGDVVHIVYYDFSLSQAASWESGDRLLCVEPRAYLVEKYEERLVKQRATERIGNYGVLPQWRKRELQRHESK